MRVFIETDLKPLLESGQRVSIFEMGFGTGLNALLTLMEGQHQHRSIYYTAIEAYPLENSLVQQLNYCELLKRPEMKYIFNQMHKSAWDKEIPLSPNFTLNKLKCFLPEYSGSQQFD